MLRSLYSGVSGLRAHQTKMDVIGNNIANVNTYGFKASRVTFSDVYYQNIKNATAGVLPTGTPATGGLGGNNSSQVGYGSKVGSIDTVMSRSGLTMTDSSLDLSIAGEGFFQVEDTAGNLMYTRAGNLSIDNQGQLVDSQGNFVLGVVNTDTTMKAAITTATPAYDPTNAAYAAAHVVINVPDAGTPAVPQSVSDLTSLSIGRNGIITGTHPTLGTLIFGRIDLATFDNPSGLDQIGGTRFKETAASGAAKACLPGLGGSGELVSSSLEMSNVDLAKEFADMITTQRGFQANSRVVTTSDEILQELVNLKR